MMRKILVLFLGLISCSGIFADDYITFDNINNSVIAGVSYREEMPPFGKLNPFSTTRLMHDNIKANCKGDDICKLKINVQTQQGFWGIGIIYVNIKKPIMEIIDTQLNNSSPDYKILIDRENKYIRIVSK